MDHLLCNQCPGKFLFSLPLFALTLLIPHVAAAQTQPVAVTVTADGNGPDLAPRFLGLSYEMSMLLPKNGRYYFDPDDQALVNAFQTLGIKSLRVGANAVDDPRIPVPQEKDIDVLFKLRAGGRSEGDLFVPLEKRGSGRIRRDWPVTSRPTMPMRSIVFPSATSPISTSKRLTPFLRNGNPTMTPF